MTLLVLYLSTRETDHEYDPDVTVELRTDIEPDDILPDVNPEPADRANHHYLVNPLAHLIKAIVNLLYVLPLYAYVFGMLRPNEGPTVLRDFLYFFHPHVNFFVFPLIDTICNRNLRNNLRNIISYENIVTHIDWRLH